MPFLLEDGTGVAGANAYIDAAFYRTYHADRGRTVPAADDPDTPLPDETIETYIVRATDYVEKRFGYFYRGCRATTTQSLGMPRRHIVVDGVCLLATEVPLLMQQAIAEYAHRVAVLDELAPDPPVPFPRQDADGNAIPADGPVIGKTEKVGPLEESVQLANPLNAATGSAWTIVAYPAADMLIAKLLRSSGGGVVH